jgi:hypothetical protein
MQVAAGIIAANPQHDDDVGDESGDAFENADKDGAGAGLSIGTAAAVMRAAGKIKDKKLSAPLVFMDDHF